jgi:hypothetical protein
MGLNQSFPNRKQAPGLAGGDLTVSPIKQGVCCQMMNVINTRVALKSFCAGIYLFSTAALATPTITLNNQLVPLFGIGTNINHGFVSGCGYQHASEPLCQSAVPYGAWADGPMNPYRLGGHTYFQIPHSENFRIKVPNNDWGNRLAWTMEGSFSTGAAIAPAQRDQVESHYNNKNWIFSVWQENNLLVGLTHHEWYRSTETINGIPGFNVASTPWIASIGWTTSWNGGSSWTMQPTSNGSGRMIVVPEPSGWTPIQQTFGFMHPSNIVKEGNYYYVFTSTFNFSRDGQSKRHGVVLLRTITLTTTLNWQYWNGSGWSVVDHNTYQGNFGPQMPHVFWAREDHCSHLYAMNVRKHKASGKWITLGSKYCLPQPPPGQDFKYQAVFSWTQSLANPTSLESNLGEVQQNGASLLSNFYYSFFETDGSADDNYQAIGSSPTIVVTKDYTTFFHQYLTLSGF